MSAALAHREHEQGLGCPAGCGSDGHECGVHDRATPHLVCGSVEAERYCSTKSIEWLRWAGVHGCPCQLGEAIA